MFGYIRPCKAELRMKEFEAFRAVYCGLCGQLGRAFGPFARFALSYDFVFLAMLGYAQSDTQPSIKRGRCFVNPLKRVPVCQGDAPLSFAADAAASALYYSLLDKIEDGRPLKKAAFTLLRPFAAVARGSAARRNPEPDRLMRGLYREQREVEALPDASLDAAAEPTAKAIAGLFGLIAADGRQKRVLERLGYLTGRYIYLCDAADDLAADLKSGEFNPLARRAAEDMPGAYEYVKSSLYMTIGEAGRTCGLLDTKSFGPVIENTVCLGMTECTDKILERKVLQVKG